MQKLFILFMLICSGSLTGQQNDALSRTIDVSGTGSVMVVPDKVRIEVRIAHEGQELQTVKKQLDSDVSKVLKFLKSFPLEAKQYQTSRISLNKNFNYQTKESQYEGFQSVTIMLTDLKRYTALMEGLFKAGVNRIEGVQFMVSNPEQYRSQARKLAVQHARGKATEISEALGQELGKAVSVRELNMYEPGPVRMKTAMYDQAEMAGSDDTIATGEIEIRVELQISYLLN